MPRLSTLRISRDWGFEETVTVPPFTTAPATHEYEPLLEANPYQPHLARLVRVFKMVENNWLFTFRFQDEQLARGFQHRPGQFVMLSVPGAGEAPISISSSPTRPEVLELCVRRVGRVTDALYRLGANDVVGIRGPYGNGFPVDRIRGNDLLIAAGGLGMAPLRSLLWYAIDKRDLFRSITLMYGARTPDRMLFRDELVSLLDRNDLRCLLCVDADPTGTWQANVCQLPSLFEQVDVDPSTTYAAVCGPPVVYRFVLKRLLALGFPKDRILMSLERRMKCGVGKCGHCSVGYKYTCVHGPIFTYWDAINLPEIV
ncbi:MAG: FAD/NAD(P)-binding protein [Gemmatimonadales bacterium]|nr:FAD/NAD(P)-binding protein [Gemmatimonadales bacterium]